MTTFIILVALTALSCARTDVATSETPVAAKPAYSGDNYKIGVILPLSGKYSVYGESSLHGIECAVGIFPPCEGLMNAELVIKDDEGLPEKAAAAVEELVRRDKVSVIIGPLSSSTIEAAAAKAQELQVPLISLSQKEGIAQIGDNIFSTALTSALQVNQIVDWAVGKKKIKNFAIVYPNNPYGQLYNGLFTEAVKNAGGRVVFVDKYGANTTDIGGIFRKSAQKYDAIFLPDSYKAVAYIASVMAMEGIEGVQLLGINRWNNEALIEQGGDLIQGAVFVDGFFTKNANRDTQRFISGFEQAYDLKPTILEAQAYDAARLASKALMSTGGEHAVDVKAALSSIPDTEGSTGPVGFNSQREAIKKLFLLTVQDDQIVELEGAAPAPKKDKYGETEQVY